MENTAPVTGDTSYVPSGWSIQEERYWDTAPYTATFRVGQGGSYNLRVTFDQQKYDGSAWVKTGVRDQKEICFTVKNVQPVSMIPTAANANQALANANQRVASTADETQTAPFLTAMAAALFAISGLLVIWKKRRW